VNLYLLERTDDVGRDEMRGVVVAAENEEDARALFPWGGVSEQHRCRENLRCTQIGVACEGIGSDVLLEDYKAG
jgi:hypothetical protein